MFKRFQPFSLQAKPVVIFIVPEPEENLEPSPKKKELETGYQLQQSWAEIVWLYIVRLPKKHIIVFFSKRFSRLSIFISLVSICMIVCIILLGAFVADNQPKRNKPKSSKPKSQKQDSTKKTGTMFSVFEKKRTS